MQTLVFDIFSQETAQMTRTKVAIESAVNTVLTPSFVLRVPNVAFFRKEASQ